MSASVKGVKGPVMEVADEVVGWRESGGGTKEMHGGQVILRMQ